MRARDPKDVEARIEQAYLDALADRPFYAIKVSALTAKAHISRSTFYVHYDSALDVLQSLEDALLEGIPAQSVSVQLLAEPARFKSALLVKLAYFETHLEVLQKLIGAHGDPYFQARMDRFFDPAFDAFSTTSGVRQQLLRQALDGARWRLLQWWTAHADAVTISELADFLTAYMAQQLQLARVSED
ncbi:TetR/AcrR family transcriptional regulator [Lacticaseibacillus yichunensis]|uniref:TetR/AcrR family transcriptional regulator n=1 Tax=Lacticaseibacillus yichunensis TaxID=2486015 RepID=A0ABW4CRQ4_9LACO|nr:TetR/AcrR family transcriptional regulator [Lacticaseibacillus yichunensis]